MPLIRKIHGLGTRVMVVGVDIPINPPIKTSQRVLDEASFCIMLSEEVESKTAKSDPIINKIFYTPK